MAAVAEPVGAVPLFTQPEGIDPGAAFAFERMIDEVGRTAFRMPTSCDMFLAKHLGAYPKERKLLSAAMNAGVPQNLLEESNLGEVDRIIARLAKELQAKFNIPLEEAKWAVEAWAVSVKRPPGYVGSLKAQVKYVDAPKRTVSPRTERLIMMLIASAGGFLGGFFGNASSLFLYSAFFLVDQQHSGRTATGTDAVVIIYFLFIAFLGGLGGGLGAAVGWWMGRGNERPWASFAAAFGAAFGAACLLTMTFRGPKLFSGIGIGMSAFGATYTCASRGGLDPS
ncbi:MAG: hypothetical protein ACRC8S_19000 [Fimbriiglobus sp.]